LPDWFTPRDLAERLEQEIAPSGFAEDPADLPGIRDYQRGAIAAIEAAISDGRREMLVAMAMGIGKTLTCVALMYRLLKAEAVSAHPLPRRSQRPRRANRDGTPKHRGGRLPEICAGL
jgi:type I site-specific restriction endonuclease